MFNDELEYIKRKIKRTYKFFTGERTDGKASLKDVAKFFNIQIDENRLEDYSIKAIDFENISIELYDKKYDTLYKANYTGNAELLNHYCSDIRFNNLISINPLRKIESLYYIGAEKPFISRMIIKQDNYNLAFEKEFTNSVGMFSNEGNKCIVRYEMEVDGKNVPQHLFNRLYNVHYKKGEFVKSLEQTYTYSLQHFIPYNDKQDKYTYIIKDNVIYGVNELEQKNDCDMMGICFEKTNVNINDYLPLNIYEKDFPNLYDKSNVSAMIFTGWTDRTNQHYLEIYKDNKFVTTKYEVVKNIYGKEITSETIVDDTIRFDIMPFDNIASPELQKIVDILTKNYGDKFIKIVAEELNTFANKIDVKEGLIKEELDELSPKLLLNKSYDEICNMIYMNKKGYFEIISNQFENATNISDAKDKEITKTLKK